MEILENTGLPFLLRKTVLAIEAKMGFQGSFGGQVGKLLSHPCGEEILSLWQQRICQKAWSFIMLFN
jgi:hypothetical protein